MLAPGEEIIPRTYRPGALPHEGATRTGVDADGPGPVEEPGPSGVGCAGQRTFTPALARAWLSYR